MDAAIQMISPDIAAGGQARKADPPKGEGDFAGIFAECMQQEDGTDITGEIAWQACVPLAFAPLTEPVPAAAAEPSSAGAVESAAPMGQTCGQAMPLPSQALAMGPEGMVEVPAEAVQTAHPGPDAAEALPWTKEAGGQDQVRAQAIPDSVLAEGTGTAAVSPQEQASATNRQDRNAARSFAQETSTVDKSISAADPKGETGAFSDPMTAVQGPAQETAHTVQALGEAVSETVHAVFRGHPGKTQTATHAVASPVQEEPGAQVTQADAAGEKAPAAGAMRPADTVQPSENVRPAADTAAPERTGRTRGHSDGKPVEQPHAADSLMASDAQTAAARAETHTSPVQAAENARRISEAVGTIKDGGKLTVKLKPEGLGGLTIEAVRTGRGTELRIIADTLQGWQAMEREMPALERYLQGTADFAGMQLSCRQDGGQAYPGSARPFVPAVKSFFPVQESSTAPIAAQINHTGIMNILA